MNHSEILSAPSAALRKRLEVVTAAIHPHAGAHEETRESREADMIRRELSRRVGGCS